MKIFNFNYGYIDYKYSYNGVIEYKDKDGLWHNYLTIRWDLEKLIQDDYFTESELTAIMKALIVSYRDGIKEGKNEKMKEIKNILLGD